MAHIHKVSVLGDAAGGIVLFMLRKKGFQLLIRGGDTGLESIVVEISADNKPLEVGKIINVRTCTQIDLQQLLSVFQTIALRQLGEVVLDGVQIFSGILCHLHAGLRCLFGQNHIVLPCIQSLLQEKLLPGQILVLHAALGVQRLGDIQSAVVHHIAAGVGGQVVGDGLPVEHPELTIGQGVVANFRHNLVGIGFGSLIGDGIGTLAGLVIGVPIGRDGGLNLRSRFLGGSLLGRLLHLAARYQRHHNGNYNHNRRNCQRQLSG